MNESAFSDFIDEFSRVEKGLFDSPFFTFNNFNESALQKQVYIYVRLVE